MTKTCDSADETFKDEVEEDIIIGYCSSKRRHYGLWDPAYSLNDMLLDERWDESSALQAKSIEANKPHIENKHHVQTSQNTSSNKIYGHFEGRIPHTVQCPARGKTCRICNKHNTFAAQSKHQLNRKKMHKIILDQSDHFNIKTTSLTKNTFMWLT